MLTMFIRPARSRQEAEGSLRGLADELAMAP
jgi:hypothetical protein